MTEWKNCSRCGLSESRNKIVFGEGSDHPKLMLIGEAPGATEDEEGKPFVGASGKLLSSVLEKLGIDRKTVFITNVVKCRPPQNREPKNDELSACLPLLKEQISSSSPSVVLCLGRFSSNVVLSRGKINTQTFEAIGRLRSKRDSVCILAGGPIPVISTYHPAYVYRQIKEGNNTPLREMSNDIEIAYNMSINHGVVNSSDARIMVMGEFETPYERYIIVQCGSCGEGWHHTIGGEEGGKVTCDKCMATTVIKP